jgi:hypothetical protein
MSEFQLLNDLRTVCASTGLWTNHENRWVLQIDRFDKRQTFGPNADLASLITEAMNWRPITRLKRVNVPPAETRYAVRKGDPQWEVFFDGQFILSVKTKKAGEEFVRRMVDGHKAAYERWQSLIVDHTTGKTEGVDYEFETVPWQEFAAA